MGYGRPQMGYEQDTNYGGTAQRWDRLSAATAEVVSDDVRPGPVVPARMSGPGVHYSLVKSASQF